MLKTERNTKTMEKHIKAAARKTIHCIRDGGYNFNSVFEHGQWWVIASPGVKDEFTDYEEFIYSVQDAEGPGTVDGFFFEELF
jgi:hypothetical protein